MTASPTHYGPVGSGAALAPGSVGSLFSTVAQPNVGGAVGASGGLSAAMGAANPYGAAIGAAAQALSAVGAPPGDANSATSGNAGNVENRINFGSFTVAGKGASASTGVPTWALLVGLVVALVPVGFLLFRGKHGLR